MAETYRVDVAFEVFSAPDPERQGQIVGKIIRLLPEGSQPLLAESTAASPDGLARIAATVPAHGPAQALRDVAQAIELMAAEVGSLDDLGRMRRTVVEFMSE